MGGRGARRAGLLERSVHAISQQAANTNQLIDEAVDAGLAAPARPTSQSGASRRTMAASPRGGRPQRPSWSARVRRRANEHGQRTSLQVRAALTTGSGSDTRESSGMYARTSA